MPSLITKWKKGNPYMYWVRSARVNGKSRIVEQIYLGPRAVVMQQIYEHFTAEKKEQIPELKRVQLKEFGASAVLYSLACQLGLVELIDSYVPQLPESKRTSLSVGQYLVIAAINRAIFPKSKRSLFNWYNESVLSRLIPATKGELSSQRFWDNMDQVDSTHIEMIQEELFKKTCTLFALDRNFLLYDTTNYYSFISTFNARATLAQRGKNKQKRADLRQISLVIVTDEKEGFPLYHCCYEGNLTDLMALQPILKAMRQHFSPTEQTPQPQSTIILDKGNVSKENVKAIRDASFSFIAAIPNSWIKEIYDIRLKDYQTINPSKEKRVKVYSKENTSLDRKLDTKGKVVVIFSPKFYRKQVRTLDLLQRKAETKLLTLAASLSEKKRTQKAVTKEIEKILKHDRLKDFFEYNLTTEDGKVAQLQWNWDKKKKTELKHRYLGKTILYTDRMDLCEQRIVTAYRSQWKLEQLFRITKSKRPGLWWPAYHWTDNKLRAHAFVCFLALTLLKIVLLRLQNANISIGVERLIEQLRQIQEVKIVYVNGKCHRVIAERKQQQEELFLALKLDQLAKQMGNTLLNH
jgi:transposase